MLRVAALLCSVSVQWLEAATRTDTATQWTLTDTITDSVTLSETVSPSLSVTESVLAHNYTTALAPVVFEAGQEVRGQITAEFTAEGTRPQRSYRHFNTTDADALQVHLYRYDTQRHSDCEAYAASPVLHRVTNLFGSGRGGENEGVFVVAAHFTFVAPPNERFILCYRHSVPPAAFAADVVNQWRLLTTGAAGQFVFTARKPSVWYHLPDPTLGQHAILQILGDSVWNFTYPPSSCARSFPRGCGAADNVKIVRRGTPCTYEHQSGGTNLGYLGGDAVDLSGAWHGEGEVGLYEGAVAGGVGALGTQHANPLVDAWASGGTYAEVHSGNATWSVVPGSPLKHAYAYVRLPRVLGEYDVCYSAFELRRSLAAGNASIGSVPLWRKLYNCAVPPCAPFPPPLLAANYTYAAHFATRREEVGWSMIDLTPGSWGDIVFDDSGRGQLSDRRAHGTESYWDPRGGDHFRIVEARHFVESAAQSAYEGSQGRARSGTVTDYGTVPVVGCWSPDLDVPSPATGWHGGYVEDGSRHAVGSRDLTRDPTAGGDAGSRLEDSPGGVTATFSSLYMPRNASAWYVCYRRTCTHPGARCLRHSGYRVLPFHKRGRGVVPQRWLRLDDVYAPGLQGGPHAAHALVPGTHDDGRNWDGTRRAFSGVPPTATWYMNDTRAGTWGPLVVERVNATDPTLLDARPWNFRREYSAGDTVGATAGGAVRLVRHDRPCDYHGFKGGAFPEAEEAESVDGGMVECNSADADSLHPACLGSASDVPHTTLVAYYLTVPPETAQYRVCHRHKGWNWRELQRSSGDAWNDPWLPLPPPVLHREEGGGDALLSVEPPALTDVSVEYADTRAAMETLFLVSDARGGATAAPRTLCGAAGLAPGCDATGDVFRLVPRATQRGCDVSRLSWDAALADTRLSLHCPVPGSGGPERSGLFAQARYNTSIPCAAAEPARRVCGGVPCGRHDPRLAALLAQTPPVYDDVVPHDAASDGLRHVAAVVALPAYKPHAADNVYRLCYKQLGSPNWVVFNASFEVQPPPALSLVRPGPAARRLVGGEMKSFRLALADGDVFQTNATTEAAVAGVPEAALVAGFHAKLVRLDAGDENANCLSEPGGTEGQAYAASTAVHRLVQDGGRNKLDFFLTVPHGPGRYALCVQVKRASVDALSWWRPRTYDVLDNGVRWYVGEGFQPTNLGLSVVSLLKCARRAGAPDAPCDPSASQHTFDTDAGRDAAKVVDAASACVDGGAATAPWGGASLHVDPVDGGLGSSGVADLGPADGPADVAEFRLVLPPVADDGRRTYKVCVWTTSPHGGVGWGGERRWVEVEQAAGLDEQRWATGMHGGSGFRTEPALVSAWNLAAALRPANGYVTGVPADTVGLAGASTTYIADPRDAAAATEQTGLRVAPYRGASGPLLAGGSAKLVAAALPASDLPDTSRGTAAEQAWGATGTWRGVSGDCLSAAHDATATGEACDGCPRVPAPALGAAHIDVVIHLPLSPGKYRVCYRVASDALASPRPWLVLPSAGSAHYALYTHPAHLEFEAAGSAVAPHNNVTAYDLRVMSDADGMKHGVSSWCNATGATAAADNTTVDVGLPCALQNNVVGHSYDLLTVANATQVCPAPPSPVAVAVPPRWYRLLRSANVSAAVADTWAAGSGDAFALPPTLQDGAGRYKVCVYKAGEAVYPLFGNGSASYVARQGVVYQMRNRGAEADGGGSGYFLDRAVASPHTLLVSSDVAYNASTQFTASDGVSADPGVALADGTTGQVTRTPLVRSGTIVTYTVQVATAAGMAFPLGSYPVEVRRCAAVPSAADVRLGVSCPPATQALPAEMPGPFAVRGVDGACRRNGDDTYGWAPGGLRQFSVRGVAVFALQYRSACPDDAFGCGVRFAAEVGDGLLWGAAHWVNVQRNVPDAVSVGGREAVSMVVAATGSTEGCAEADTSVCVLLVCTHDRPCEVPLQARFRGPPEFAPAGNVSLLYSAQDYGQNFSADRVPTPVSDAFGDTVGPAPLLAEAPWRAAGTAAYEFTPRLRGDRTETAIYFNATYGSGRAVHWTRFVVTVRKPVFASAFVDELRPLDVELGLTAGRIPTPALVLLHGGAGSGQAPRAQRGAYLEALTPYRVAYTPGDVDGLRLDASAGLLAGWHITGRVEESAACLVLRVGDPAATYVADPVRLLAQGLLHPLKATQADTSLRLRVHVGDNACSRFANGGDGCTVALEFRRGARVVTARFRSPVRIPASTVLVEAEAAASARVGSIVAVYPGTYVAAAVAGAGETFVYDEFHLGDAFALMEAPPPTDGSANRDGLSIVADASAADPADPCAFEPAGGGWTAADGPAGCAVVKYPCRRLTGASGEVRWGARWRLRPNMPCLRCPFTFHTTRGAGPESHAVRGGLGQRGVQSFYWHDETVELQCTSLVGATSVGFVLGGTASDRFDLRVTAGVAGLADVSAEYPRWWVFADTMTDVVHLTAGNSPSGQSYRLAGGPLLRARMGEGAVAVFEDLSFEGAVAPDVGSAETLTIRFHSIGVAYEDVGVDGSMPTSSRHVACTSTISMVRTFVAKAETRNIARVVGVDGARPLCSPPCTQYTATVSEFARDGLTVRVGFFHVAADGVETADERRRNVTLVPAGGPGTNPLGFSPAWTHDAKTFTYTSTFVTLDSARNPALLESFGGHTYTFGKLEAVATRVYPAGDGAWGAVVVGGVGGVTLRYASAQEVPDESPVREAVVSLCDAQWDGQEEATGPLCVQVSLWIVPDAEESPAVALWGESPGGDKERGYSGECGADVLSLSAVAYTTPPSVTTGHRYILYSSPVEYRLSVAQGSQLLVAAGTTVSRLVLARSSAVPAGAGLTHTLGVSDIVVRFSFTGRDTTPAASLLQVTAQITEGGDVMVAPALTQGAYTWVDQQDTISHWELSDAVTADNECPSKRYLHVSRHSYQTVGPITPGLGWAYNSTAAAGLPFPVETVVRTTLQRRADSFPSGTLVRVTKHSWSGCNDGGALTVYTLKETTEADGVGVYGASLTSSWVVGEDGGRAVKTHQGVAVAWVVFAEECEACSLRLDLCYAGRTADTCLDNPSDAAPIYADRTRVTLPIKVRKPAPTAVHIVEQTLPAEPVSAAVPGQRVIIAGDVVELTVEAIQQFGRWHIVDATGWALRVWVRTAWLPTDPFDVAEARYGSGGFVGAGRATGAGCDTPLGADEFRTAAPRLEASLQRVGSGASHRALGFYLVRPCSACEVWLDYELAPPANDTRSTPRQGSFPLRVFTGGEPGAPLRLRVVTCGLEWFLCAATPAVMKRRSFSLTVLRTDLHHLPAVGRGATQELAPWRVAQRRGNGGGGDAVATSPLEGGGVRAVAGSATLRLALARACYQCAVMLGGRRYAFTVLTEATQIIAIPVVSGAPPPLFDSPLAVGVWTFNIYAADEVGDRAYTLGGPTPFAFQPRYSVPAAHHGSRAGSGVSATVAYDAPLIDIVVQTDGATARATVPDMLPDVSLSSGGGGGGVLMHNGVAVGGAAPGQVYVELRGRPGMSLSLGFEVAEAAWLPTVAFGERRQPRVDFAARATHVALADTLRATGGVCRATLMSQGTPSCSVRAYAVSGAPGAVDGQWYLSTEALAEPAHATVACAECGVAVVSPAAAPFVRGAAEFTLTLQSLNPGVTTACACNVTVQPPLTLRRRGATNQTASISFTPKTVGTWLWQDSPDLTVTPPDASAMVAESTASSVFNRTVRLSLKAFDSSGLVSNLGGIRWTNGYQVGLSEMQLSPPGCFVCLGRVVSGTGEVSCPLAAVSDEQVWVRGVFPSVGECMIGRDAFTGLPTGDASLTTPAAALRIAVGAPDTAVLVPETRPGLLQGDAVRSNFTQLSGRTLASHEAAVCGSGAYLNLHILDKEGRVATGDNHMLFVLTGARQGNTTGGLRQWPTTPPHIARQGRTTFHLDINETTRTAACDAEGSAGGACAHAPWFFDVRVIAPLTRSDGVSTSELVTSIHDIGPLHFVRRASALLAFAAVGDACGDDTEPGEQAAEAQCAHLTLRDQRGVRGRVRAMAQAGYATLGLGGEGGHEGRRVLGDSAAAALGRHPASWGVGFPFNLSVFAVDAKGARVSHVEDVGSAAVLYFNAMAVPCANVDARDAGRWIESTCVDAGGRCEHSPGGVDSMPQCSGSESSGWTLGRVQLSQGAASLAGEQYGFLVDNRHNRAFPAGVQRFFLTTADFSGQGGAWTGGPLEEVAFPFEMLMQAATHLTLKGMAFNDTLLLPTAEPCAQFGRDTPPRVEYASAPVLAFSFYACIPIAFTSQMRTLGGSDCLRDVQPRRCCRGPL